MPIQPECIDFILKRLAMLKDGHFSLEDLKDSRNEDDGDLSLIVNSLEELCRAQALKNTTEGRFHAVIDACPIPIAINNERLEITYLNPAFTKIFGYKNSDIPNLETWWPKAYPDEQYRQWVADSWAKELARVKSTGSEFSPMEINVKCMDGSFKTVLASAAALSSGFAGDHLVLLYDITERNHIQRNLNVANREILNLRAALDKHSILSIIDLDGRIKFANGNFSAVSKYSNTEVVGRPHSELFSLTENQSELWTRLSQGESWQGNVKCRAKDGSDLWLFSTYFPIGDENGTITQFLQISANITDKIERENEYAFIIKSLGIGVWRWNIRTNELEWDDNMFHLYGIKREDFSTAYEAWETFLSPDTKERAVAELNAAVRGEQDFDTTFQVTHKSGKVQEIRARAIVIRDENGLPLQMYGVNVDRSREVELEKSMETERAKAIHSSRLASLGELSAGVAHEINNPLAIISAAASQLSKFVNDPKKLDRKIENILDASLRIEKIVKGLKKFARTSETEVRTKNSLSDIIHETLGLIGVKSIESHVPVIVDAPVDGIINCDPVEIEQVLINLINNAIDAVKGTKDPWVKIITLVDENSIFCRIIDSGKGISDKIKDKIFMPFFTTKGEGTGLGLSISKGIIDSHKGTLRIIDDLPNTCFEIELPKHMNILRPLV